MNESVSAAVREEYLEKGFVKITGFRDAAEVSALTSWVDDITTWPPSEDRWMHHFEQTPGGVQLARTENLLPYHEGLRNLLTVGKVPNVIGMVLGEPAVLYKEKINYKHPGGGGYAAHQDAPAYDFIKRHITCSIAIDAATPENGCLEFVAGMHKQGLLPMDDSGCIDPELAEAFTWEAVPMLPGDALLFSSYAPHRSSPNETDRPRRSLYLTYNALAEGNLREQYYRDKRRALEEKQQSGDARISKIGHFRGKLVP